MPDDLYGRIAPPLRGIKDSSDSPRVSKSLAQAAKVAELVDALDLGSSVARRESSSLSFRTIARHTLSGILRESECKYLLNQPMAWSVA